jgi:hypothetical protein
MTSHPESKGKGKANVKLQVNLRAVFTLEHGMKTQREGVDYSSTFL